MRNKSTILVLILVTILAIAFFVSNGFSPKGWDKMVVSPSPNPTPNAPKTFKFDRTSDLKKELDNVQPQLLDKDFE